MEGSSSCPCFQKNFPFHENYRPIAILNNFYKILVFIIYDHVSHFSKSKLNLSQLGFITSKSNVINLVTVLDYVTHLVCSQCQTTIFDFSNAFDILPHALLHHKFSNCGLSSGYLNWFFSYLTNKQPRVHYSGIFSLAFVRSGVSFMTFALYFFYK
jgi:hypothetical protein